MKKQFSSKIYTLAVCTCIFLAEAILQPEQDLLLKMEVKAQAKATAASTNKIPEELHNLYAQSAVLMDGDSGRILFAKNGQQEMAMASTTKIMTCIVALEHSDSEQIVEVSANAQKQPQVKLGMEVGEQYLLRDLLYSLMLESHNDTAVAVAEAVGQSVEGFAALMNQKAKELGCEHTYFITPNGLDASDEHGIHHTTAADLARIMKYCIRESPMRSLFLEITQTSSYQFYDKSGKRSFSCQNHNAFLHMMDGALSGKTGFTGDAGYCYVGALQRGKPVYIVALLACGWPNNKSYKWSDTRKLMEYGLSHYQYKTCTYQLKQRTIPVENGIPASNRLFEAAAARLYPSNELDEFQLLLGDTEELLIEETISNSLKAPVTSGIKAGTVRYRINGLVIREIPVLVEEGVKEISLPWIMKKITAFYLP